MAKMRDKGVMGRGMCAEFRGGREEKRVLSERHVKCWNEGDFGAGKYGFTVSS
jgi:hypothetical protein